ncbi:MAG: ATP synthase F1 subunit gamma [Rickettsiales bacterium]|nr:MAG: ATP synthase F1 subunit gamma [Rickettsiales bacterium]
MSNLKQLRNRVRSIKSTQKITKAMHVVSASKLKKLKEKAEGLNHYTSVLGDIMHDISTSGNLMDLPICDRKFFSEDLKKMSHLLVIMTSERGLCGGFNSSVIRSAKRDIARFQKEGKQVKLLVIGKKGCDAFSRKYADMIEGTYHNNKASSACVSLEVKNKIMEMVENEEIGACYMYYNLFKNAMTQILTTEQVLPAHTADEAESGGVSEYEYEGENVVHNVIDLYIGGQINYGLLQSRASEECSRMTAMDNATRNAGDLIDSLTLKLNRSRQAIITTELTEIISGAEAV